MFGRFGYWWKWGNLGNRRSKDEFIEKCESEASLASVVVANGMDFFFFEMKEDLRLIEEFK